MAKSQKRAKKERVSEAQIAVHGGRKSIIALRRNSSRRPAAWEQIAGTNLRYPVRITGQLFFDASHKPCKGGKGPNPQRISIWGIHPVYAIDVCSSTTLAACSVSDESVWTPLDQWLATGEGGISQLRGPQAPSMGRLTDRGVENISFNSPTW